MKKVFNYEYPDENIRAITKWLQEKLVKPDGSLSEIGYYPNIIIEILPRD